MFETDAQTLAEIALRAFLVFAVLLFAFRLAGKRHLGQMTPFDLLVLLLISESVQNAIVGDDHSLPGGFVAAAVLILLSVVLGWITFRSKRAAHLIEGKATVLMRDGKILREHLDSEGIPLDELHAAMRQQGIASFRDVKVAAIEVDGSISVVPKSGGGTGSGKEMEAKHRV